MLNGRRFPAVLPLVLFLALPLFADVPPQILNIHPAQPTNRSGIEFGIATDCPYGPQSVSRTGSLITVLFSSSHLCDPPFNTEIKIPYPGLLEPGTYQVQVVDLDGKPYASTTVVVRDAAADPFFVAPFAVPDQDPSWVRLVPNGSAPLCPAGACVVRFDGVAALAKKVDPTGNLWAIPPSHAGDEYVSVSITTDTGTQTVPSAMYYIDRDGPANLAVFERVLFPLLVTVHGGHGSDWRTEAVISNPGDWYLETWNNIIPIICVTSPCGERLEPGQQVKFEGEAFPKGVALLVPRPQAAQMSFSLRVRDVSRQADSFGTSIPVVREAQFFHGTMTLLNVPLDPAFRAKLRVYGFAQPVDYGAEAVTVTILNPLSHRKSTHSVFFEPPSCGANCVATEPYYADFDIPVSDIPGERVDLYVDVPEEMPAWAFVSVTNNKTQEVTTVIPDGTGGEPCGPCAHP
jgi:hypothetical protein